MRKVSAWLNRQSKSTVAGLALLPAALVGTADFFTLHGFSFTLFYLLIVAGTAWFGGRKPGLCIALVCTVLLMEEEWRSPLTSKYWGILCYNGAVRLAILLFTAWTVAGLKRLTDQLDHRVRARTAALEAEMNKRRQTEAQLRESMQRFHQVTGNIAEVFWMTNLDKTEMLYVSPGYEKIWGRTCESLYASPRAWLEAIHPEDRDRVLQAALTRQARGDYDEEYRIVRPDGALRWIRDRAFPVRDEAGAVCRIAGLAEDITERKRAEDKLRESEDYYRLLFECSPDPLMVIDVETEKFLCVNRAAVDYYGYTCEELLSMHSMDLRPPKAVPALQEHVQALRARLKDNPRLPVGIWPHRKKDGRVGLAESSASAIACQGRSAVLIHARDVTERMRLEAQVAKDRQRLETASAAGAVALWEWDLAAGILEWSSAVDALLGYSAGEFPRTISAWEAAIHPDDRAPVLAALDAHLKQDARYAAEYRVRRKDGTYVWWQDAGKSRRDSGGQVIHMAGACGDITERKQAEEALRHSEERFAKAFQSSPIACGITTCAEGRFVDVNDTFLRLTGFRRDEVVGRTSTELGLWSPAERAVLLQSWQAAGNVTGAEIPLRIKSGAIRTMLAGLELIELGGTRHILSQFQDITERKEMEATLRLQERVLRHMVESVQLVDEQGIIRFTNPATEAMFGYPAGELVGQHVSMLSSLPEAEYRRVFAEITEQIQTRGMCLGEFHNRRKDGTEFVTEAHISSMSFEGARYTVAVRLDISDRRRQETMRAKFLERQERLNQLQQALLAPGALGPKLKLITDGVVDIFGADFCRVWGTSPGDLCDRGCRHAAVTKGPHVCRHRQSCLHLLASSGRYTQTDGEHQRVPFGAYKIGRVASGQDHKFLTNDVVHDPRVHDHAWARELGLVAFAGYQLRPPGGETLGVLALFSKLALTREEDAQLDGLSKAVARVIQRARAEEALQRSEARFRTLFEAAPLGIALHGAHGRYVETNRSYQEMLGYTNEELLQLGVKRVTHPEDVAEGQRLYEDLRAGRRDRYQREERYLGKDGRLIWAQSHAAAVRDDRGQLEFIVSLVEDITERTLAQQALAESQHRQTALLDNIPEPAWLKDAEGRFLACNPSLAKVYGQTPERIVGGRVADFLPQEAARLTREDEQVMQSRRLMTFEARLVSAPGITRWFETIKSPVLDANGQVTGTVGVARDVTERKWIESLLQHQRDFGVFLSSASDLKVALAQLLKLAVQSDGVDCGGLYLVDPDSGRLELATHQGLSARFIARAAYLDAKPVPERGAREAGPPSRPHAGPLPVVIRHLKREGWRTLEAVPIQDRGQVVAVLFVGSHVRGEIPPKTCQALETFAVQAGGALSRIRAEQSSRASRELLQKTLDSLRTAVFVVEAETATIRDCNAAAARLFGYAREEMVGQAPAALHLDAVLPRGRAAPVPTAVKADTSRSEFEAQMRRKNGTAFTAACGVTPLQDEAGRVTGWVGVFEDISERKRTQEVLQQTQNRQKAILDNVPDPIWLKDLEGRYLACNKALAGFHGTIPKVLIGQRDRVLMLRDEARITREDAEVIRSGKSLCSESEMTDARGHTKWFETIKSPVFDPSGRVTGTVGIARDVTERKRVEGELRQLPRRIIEAQEAERLRVARDLHDGTNQIIASTKMRLRKVEEHVAALSPAAREILARCGDLLSQALEENRRIAYNLRPGELDALGLIGACRRLGEQLQARSGLTVKCHLTRDRLRASPTLELNAFRIVQEALHNAERHAGAKTIRLRMALQGDTLVIRIRDDGRGFDPQAARAGPEKARGLGLANLRERAAFLGGTCGVESAPNRGTTITVRLPCADTK